MIEFTKEDYEKYMNIGYESPIQKITSELRTEMEQKEEQCLIKTVQDVGFVVDKEELYKALKYDREQYEQGYNDMYKKYRDMLNFLRTRCVSGAEELFDNHQFSLLNIVPNYENGVKPIKRPCNVTGVVGWYCGACDIMNVSEKPSYCRRCGTKIDWSDNNE